MEHVISIRQLMEPVDGQQQCLKTAWCPTFWQSSCGLVSVSVVCKILLHNISNSENKNGSLTDPCCFTCKSGVINLLHDTDRQVALSVKTIGSVK